MTAAEAIQHHQNLIYRRCLEKLQAEQPLTDEELAEVRRRETEEKKQTKAEPKPRKGRGRPDKLTRELIKTIRRHIAAGNTYKNACLMARIAEGTFSRWMNSEKNTPLLCELRQAVKEALAEAEAAMVDCIQKAAKNETWCAAAWMLERRNPETWGKKDTIRAEHSGPNGAPLPAAEPHIVVYLPDNGRAVTG